MSVSRALLPLAFLLSLVAALSATRDARAHDTRTAQIEIDALSPGEARVLIRPAHVELRAPEGCTLARDAAGAPAATSATLRCSGALADRVVAVGLGDVDLAFVRLRGFTEREAHAVVTRADASIVLPGRASASSVLTRFVRLGIEHVAGGLDHVLFLLALFWQAYAAGGGSWKKTGRLLARTATAFTLAHSVTLAGTALGLIHVPQKLAEACIAASLVLVALDVGRDEPASSRQRALLAGAFGLVHGLGFAGALAETRLPAEARGTALAAFNIGVELGQVALFAIGTLVLVLARRAVRAASFPQRLERLSAYVVGASGAAMLFLRAAALFR